MKTQEIGQSGMIASRVALGVMRMDALDAADAARTVAVAHDSGIDYFDTADIYGFHDHAAHASSKRFGQAWKDAGLDRSTIFIQTKFGIDYSFGENDGGANGYDFSAKHLIDALDHELEALQTDYVDAVLLHRIDTLFELNEVAEAFDALESSGKVRHFGVSNMGPWQIELLQSGLRQKLEINQLQFGLMHTHRWHPALFTAEAYDHSGMVPIPIRHGIRSVRRQRAFPRAERRIDPSCRQIRFHAQRHCRRLDSASSRRYPAVARLNDTGAHPPDGGRCRYRTRTP